MRVEVAMGKERVAVVKRMATWINKGIPEASRRMGMSVLVAKRPIMGSKHWAGKILFEMVLWDSAHLRRSAHPMRKEGTRAALA